MAQLDFESAAATAVSEKGRPYSTFGLHPFLWIEEADWQQIQKRYRELSRQYHPDRIDPSDEEALATAESLSARLNTDLAKLRDLTKRLEVAVAGLPDTAKAKQIPELATDYFELQEIKADAGPSSSQFQTEASKFKKRVDASRAELQAAVDAVARKYPFKGFAEEARDSTDSTTPPSADAKSGSATENAFGIAAADRVLISKNLGELRYLQRILDEIAL